MLLLSLANVNAADVLDIAPFWTPSGFLPRQSHQLTRRRPLKLLKVQPGLMITPLTGMQAMAMRLTAMQVMAMPMVAQTVVPRIPHPQALLTWMEARTKDVSLLLINVMIR